MSVTQKYFDDNGYVVVSNVIPTERCQQLTKHMHELAATGKTQNDPQCPLSDAIYGDPQLDELLEQLCGPIGKTVGKRLLPTYTYARVYRPGETLKKHVDRQSCEISATLTLGYDGKVVWPILFDENKNISVDLEVGEMAIYKGCEVVHWRDAFKGNWHVQVFLHYVDADGPYADYVFDKRGGLSHHKVQQPVIQATPNKVADKQTDPIAVVRSPVFGGIMIPSTDKDFPGLVNANSQHWSELVFTEEECNKIIEIARDSYPQIGSIGADKSSTRVDRSIRSADIYTIDNNNENRWIYEKVVKAISISNAVHFDFDISGISHSLQLLHYKANATVPGHYDWHADTGRGEASTRKITFVAQLSRPQDYDGGELVVNDHGNLVVAPKERGSINLFPSYQVHKVTPITRGERFSLVVWAHGSRRFR